MSETRKLATILFADIVGYTALMQSNETQALNLLNQFKAILEQNVSAHDGKIVQYFGDGCLLCFDSTLQGVQCAMALQKAFTGDAKIPVRIGMHLGDVVFKNENVFGDGVNIASRVESLGVTSAVLLSKPIRDQIRNHGQFQLISLGFFDFKNVDESMEVFALSNEGFAVPKKEAMQGKLKGSLLYKRPKWRILALTAGLVLLIAAAWYMGSSRTRAGGGAAIQSMAIFPFLNNSGNPELDYLGEGIAENLIAQLASRSDVRVISRFSSFPLQDSLHNLSYIVRLLDVDAMLVGKMTEDADDLVLDTELIASSDHSQLWGSKVKGTKTELSKMENQITTALLTSLEPNKKSISYAEIKVDPLAYQHYMQGRFLSYGSSQKEMDQAIEHFHKAIEIDPNYAPAYAALANQKTGQARFSNTSRQELLREARLALKSAFSIDPDLPEAHLAEANIRFFCDFDWTRAEESYRKALASDPDNASIYADFAFFQCAMNRYDEALDLAKEAIRLDPISISSMHIIAWSRLYKYPEQGVQDFERIIELHPNWIWGYMKKGMAEILIGDCPAALESFKAVEERKGAWGGELLESYLSILYKKCGQDEKSQMQKEYVLAHVEIHGVSDPLNIAALYGGLGDMDQMIRWTKKCIEQKSVNVALMQLAKDLDFFQGKPFYHPDYQRLLDQMKFPGNAKG